MSNKVSDYFNNDALAANVWADKYCLKDSNGVAQEETPADMHLRMAKEFARIEYNYKSKEAIFEMNGTFGYKPLENLSKFGSQLVAKRNAQTLQQIEKEFFNYFDKFGLIVPQGSIMSNLGNFFIYGSLSNCFGIADPYDSYGGILKSDEHLAQLMKRRGGVGLNLDNIRPSGTSVSNASKSSTGVVPYAERFSNTTREVAQEGRRGALMQLLHCNHPEVFKFVTMKDDRTKVTGANVSVKFTDEFMQALENNEDFICRFPVNTDVSFIKKESLNKFPYNELIPTETASQGKWSIMKIKPQELFDLVAEMAWKNAEPGVAFLDRVVNYSPEGVYDRYKPKVCNPCLIAGTEILTENGYEPIETKVNIPTKIWNGFEWSEVTPKITGHNQHTIKITLSDGRSVTSTDYHKWYIAKGYRGDREVKETRNLKIGDKLIKYNFPIIKDGKSIDAKEAYTQGFVSADGQDNYNHLWLYETKYMCKTRLDGQITSEFEIKSGLKRGLFKLNKEYQEKSFMPFNWNLESKLSWLSGLLDGDGSEMIEGGCQLWSVELRFLQDLQKFLSTLGVNSKIVLGNEEANKLMPDGKGGEKEYLCQKSYRILLGATQIQSLKSIGLNCERLQFNKTPNRDASQFVKVVAIEDAGYADTVYCFTEPKRGYGVFNGILTGQCGEQWFAFNETCRLIALNLWNIVKNHFSDAAKIDYQLLYEVAYMQQRLGDNLVDLECEYIDRILAKIALDPEPEEIKHTEMVLWQDIQRIAREGRRTGGGFTALGDMLAALNLKYDSDEAIATVEKVMKTKMEAELDCTIDMAILRGTFVGWQSHKEYLKITNERENYVIQGTNMFFEMLLEDFPEQAHRMYEFGRRNTNWSTVAPTGTVSLMTQTTSGLEPLFKAYYIRRKKINPSEEGNRIDYTDQSGDNWQEYPVLHPKFKEWIQTREWILEEEALSVYKTNNKEPEKFDKELLERYFKESPWYKSEADDISWEKRIDIQAIIQKYTSNAISSTINLPANVAQQVVKDIYLRAYHKGLKGVTVYRDGSRSGVLISEPTKAIVDKFGYTDAVKRPTELEGHYHPVTIKGKLFAVIIGLVDGLPYELFAFESPVKNEKIEGKVVKNGKGEYSFISNSYTIKNIQLSSDHTDEKLLTRMCSQLLRHGVNPKHIVEQVEKTQVTVVSFAKAIIRVLRLYIPESNVKEKCKVCGETTVVYEENCRKCLSCGDSKC